MDSLDIIIPVMATNYAELDIYAWNSNANKPYSSIIGNQGGACICGNDVERYMVLEIPEDEFTFESMHRYSVIPHEMFHAYQMSISKNFYDGDFRIKWLSEGTAASFESIYIQQNYSYNYFKFDQNRVDIEVLTSPEIFENYDSLGDINYSSSVFITLVLVKELQKNNISEEKVFELVFRNFLQKNPNDENWKNIFEEVFSISLENFYSSISNYSNDGRVNSITEDPHTGYYISRRTDLAQPATSLKVIVSAYRHSSADFRVLYELFRVDSNGIEQAFELFPGFDNLTDTNGDGFGDKVVDSILNNGRPDAFTRASADGEYIDYQFSADNLAQFNGFRIKIVMSGTNEARAPRFRDFRVIALA